MCVFNICAYVQLITNRFISLSGDDQFEILYFKICVKLIDFMKNLCLKYQGRILSRVRISKFWEFTNTGLDYWNGGIVEWWTCQVSYLMHCILHN